MVDLPKVPRRIVTVEEPRSGLSGRDIAAPYAALSEAFKDTSETLTAAAEAHVADAATKAVTVGADGQINVQRTVIPMVGPVGRKYHSLVAHGAVVEADTLADRDLIDLRQQSRGDPNAFRASAEAYRDDRVASLTTTIGPAAGQALKRQIDNRITQAYGGLVTEHQNKAIARANEAIDARIVTLGNEMETLARRGGATGDEFEQRRENVKALLDQKVNNPLLAYPAEKAAAYLDALNTRVQGAAIHEQMERVYRERGFEAARNYLRTSTRELDGRVKQLDQIERGGLAWLRAEEAGFRGERDAVSREWAAAKGQAQTLPRESLLDLRDRARALGATRVASDVESHMQALDHLAVVRSLPAGERAFVAVTGTLPQNLSPTQRDVQTSIDSEARRQGVDPRIATAIAWRESRLNPAAAAKTSTARGIFQLTQANQQRLGVAPDAPMQDQVRAGVQIVKETTDNLRATLGREPTAAEVYMGHFQGAGAAAAIIRAAPDASLKATLDAVRPQFRGPNGESWGDTVIKANPFLKDMTVGNFRAWAGRAMGVEGRTDLTETRGGLLALGMVKKEMAKELTSEIATLRQTIAKEEFPPLADVVALGDKVHAIGTPEQRREVAELVAIAKVGQQFQTLPAAQRAQVIAEADTELRSNGAARFDSRLRANLRKADADITAAYKADPYGAFARFGQGPAAQATPAVDFAKPQEAATIIGVRAKQQGIIRDQQGIGPFSVLRPAEAEAFRGLLATGDAPAVAAAFGALNQLPEDMLAATLANPAVKSGITASLHTTDAAKMNAVMSNLDAWYRRDPQAFNARFGPEAWNALKTWQSNLRYMTPEDFAKRQTQALDPGQQEIRTKNIQKGETDARARAPADVVAAMNQAWLTLPFGGLRAPAAPTDPQVRDLLMADYVNLYGRRYADTLDKDQAHTQAVEALGQKWQRSLVNNAEVMLRAPESVYPMVSGSHDWMTPQLEAAIAEQIGVPMRQTVPSLAPGAQGVTMAGPRNWEYRLVADPTTEQEAQRYDRSLPVSDTNRPPSYQVIVRDNRRQTAKWEPMPQRFAFDPSTAQAAGREQFETARTGEQTRREGFERRMATPGEFF